jgi:hypothetical protein
MQQVRHTVWHILQRFAQPTGHGRSSSPSAEPYRPPVPLLQVVEHPRHAHNYLTFDPAEVDKARHRMRPGTLPVAAAVPALPAVGNTPPKLQPETDPRLLRPQLPVQSIADEVRLAGN